MTFIPPSCLLPENSCRNKNVVFRLEKNVNTHARFELKLLPPDRSVPGTKSQQSPSFCPQACYPRAPAGMEMWYFVWKKNGTHMLNLNSHFFQLIGRFLVPNPSRHLHPAFTLATRELLPPRKELEQKRRPAGCLISSWKPAKRHCNPDVRSHQCPAAGTILVEKLRQARVD